MTVQSARVQKIVKGDDVVLKHQIMGDKAYDAELSRAPVLVQSADTVNFFYPSQDPTFTDLVGYPGTQMGGYPTSEFNVEIPGNIVGPPVRGTNIFQSGEGMTVRAEITRQNGKKETYYLFEEVDIEERGFPVAPIQNTLP